MPKQPTTQTLKRKIRRYRGPKVPLAYRVLLPMSVRNLQKGHRIALTVLPQPTRMIVNLQEWLDQKFGMTEQTLKSEKAIGNFLYRFRKPTNRWILFRLCAVRWLRSRGMMHESMVGNMDAALRSLYELINSDEIELWSMLADHLKAVYKAIRPDLEEFARLPTPEKGEVLRDLHKTAMSIVNFAVQDLHALAAEQANHLLGNDGHESGLPTVLVSRMLSHVRF
jgi:hypothetical protein